MSVTKVAKPAVSGAPPKVGTTQAAIKPAPAVMAPTSDPAVKNMVKYKGIYMTPAQAQAKVKAEQDAAKKAAEAAAKQPPASEFDDGLDPAPEDEVPEEEKVELEDAPFDPGPETEVAGEVVDGVVEETPETPPEPTTKALTKPSQRRIYVVREANEGVAPRLVRATGKQQAKNHVSKNLTSELATQEELVDLIGTGTMVEDAVDA